MAVLVGIKILSNQNVFLCFSAWYRGNLAVFFLLLLLVSTEQSIKINLSQMDYVWNLISVFFDFVSPVVWFWLLTLMHKFTT